MDMNGVTGRVEELSPLAREVLSDHQRAPTSAFYDLLRLGRLFSTTDVMRLDEAYLQLERGGYVERLASQSVSFGGNIRPVYRLANLCAGSKEDE